VAYFRGWHELRREDLGLLREHLALTKLQAHLGRAPIHDWRSTHGNEVDFVIARRGGPPAAIECTWSAEAFDPAHLRAFRARYPGGPSFVVGADVEAPRTRRSGGVSVEVVSLPGLLQRLRASRGPGRRRRRDRQRGGA
jgi:hypothetical protein